MAEQEIRCGPAKRLNLKGLRRLRLGEAKVKWDQQSGGQSETHDLKVGLAHYRLDLHPRCRWKRDKNQLTKSLSFRASGCDNFGPLVPVDVAEFWQKLALSEKSTGENQFTRDLPNFDSRMTWNEGCNRKVPTRYKS